MDNTKTTSHVGLCAGYGGIELGLKRVIPNLRSVALCEIEAFACANLVAKMEAGLMDPAPIWTDLKTFPWQAFRDRVDVLTGGYPCQPFSSAGLRRGKDDPRHLWPYIADGIRLMRPRLCFFENVEGHISLGLPDVIEDLVGMGYRVAWGIFSASEVGAPHQRKRMFIMAHRIGTGLEGLLPNIGTQGWENAWGSTSRCSKDSREWMLVSFAADCGSTDGELDDECSICGGVYSECGCPGPTQDGFEYTEIDGELYARPVQQWPARPGEPQNWWEPPRVVHSDNNRRSGHVAGTQAEHDRNGQEDGLSGATSAVGDAEQLLFPASREHGAVDEASEVSAGERGQSPQTDPEPSASREREGIGANAAERTEAQSSLGGDADGPASGMDYAELCVTCDNRTDELRLLGNGVVPATAEKAFLVLLEKLMGRS